MPTDSILFRNATGFPVFLLFAGYTTAGMVSLAVYLGGAGLLAVVLAVWFGGALATLAGAAIVCRARRGAVAGDDAASGHV